MPENWRKRYMLNVFMDVTNIKECVLLLFFSFFSLWLFNLIYRDYGRINKMTINRSSEKADMLVIKKILLINTSTQFLAYLLESGGYYFVSGCDDNYYFIVPICYFFLNVTFMTSLQICCWRSTLIWGQLICMKMHASGLLKLVNYLKTVPLVDVLILLINTSMIVLFITQSSGQLNLVVRIMSLMVAINSILILLVFLVASLLFQTVVLTQSEIPAITKRRVFISIVSLTLSLLGRLIWNIFLLFPDQRDFLDEQKCGKDCKCSEPDNLFWFFYELIYFPIADLIPVFLFNRIYSPQRNAETRINRLIDSD